MKVRKLAVALALAGGLGSGVAQALGLGEIEIQSYLNQPMNAEIDVNRLDGVSPNDIIVNLASEQDFERVGLRRDFFLTRLNFEVTTAPNGELVISVTSSEPVREPYLNFLVEVTWPSGRVMREYSVLVDPPVYAEDSGVSEPVQTTQTRQTQTTSQPRDTADQGTRPASGDAPTTRSAVSGTLEVQASDTLWEIAERVRPDTSVSMEQVMLAIQDLNPDAFINGNINRIKRGEILRVPDVDDMTARTRAQASREVAAQHRAFAQPEPEVDATQGDVAASGSGDGAGQASSDELRLVVPEEGEDARSDGSAGGDGRQGGTADAGEAVALEELDRVQRENDELNSRVEDLQDQVETLQRLIELKDTQLAEIQGGMAEEAEPTEEPADGASEQSDMTAMEPGAEDAADDTAPADGDAASMADDTMAQDGETADEAVDTGMPEDEAEPADDAMSGMDEPVMTDEDMTAGDDATAMQPQDDPQPADAAADGPVAATGEQPEADQSQPVRPAQDKGFLATAIDLIAGNFLYQIALGGFLVLLLLVVLLISRRRANNEDEFYQQLDEGDEDDGFELTLGEEEAAEFANAMEEADRYVSYGQHEAAAEVLENAISREPSRSDLRLKLLAVYADTGNRAAFDKQYAELEAMELDDAQPEAEALRARLEEAESTPSIDELESQLRGGDALGESRDGEASDNIASTPMDEESNELMSSFEELDLPEENAGELEEDDKDSAIEYDFSGLDTSDPAEEEATRPEPESTPEEADDGLGGIDFELPEEQDSEADASDRTEEESLELDDDFGSLELDDAGVDSEPAAEDVEGAAEPTEEDNLDFGDLELEGEGEEPADHSANPEDEADMDESFLDELDAELDKVTSGDSSDDDGLEDLELDVSDEDLELMDQASESEPEDESQLDLGDLDLEEPESASEAAGEEPAGDDLSDLEIPELDNESVADEEAGTPVDESEPRSGDKSSIDEIDEASLGDDDDFDFLSGTDEVATKLDLARAYVDMGDSEGAREILEEVILEGSDEQKTEAQSLLKKLP